MGTSAYPEGARKFLRQSAVLILGAQASHQAKAEGRFEMATLPAASHVSKRARAILADNAFEFGSYLIYGLVPGDTLKTFSHALQRIFESVGVMLMISDVHALTAEIALAFDIGLIRLHFDNAVVFRFHFQTAVLRTEDTAGFMNRSHLCSFSTAAWPDTVFASLYMRGGKTQLFNNAVKITLLLFSQQLQKLGISLGDHPCGFPAHRFAFLG